MSVLTQRSDGLRGGGLMNVGAQTHQSCPPPPLFLFTPTAPSHPITGSLRAPSLDSNRGSLPLDRGADAEVPLSSAGLVTLSSVHVSQFRAVDYSQMHK